MLRFAMSALGCWALIAAAVVADEPAEKTEKPQPTQEELEKQFAETMSGATLVGRFTLNGQNLDQPLKEDRYTLGKVSKLKNGLWSFETRIQYGQKDAKVTLALPVKWAGDTPVISLTNLLVPGFGTFTARVVVYRGEYAGTWSGGDHGGQMFGKIEKAGTQPKTSEKPAASN